MLENMFLGYINLKFLSNNIQLFSKLFPFQCKNDFVDEVIVSEEYTNVTVEIIRCSRLVESIMYLVV